MELGKLLRGNANIRAKWQKGVGEISLPSAPIRFRGRPTHVWAGDGGWEDGNYKRECRKWENSRDEGGVGQVFIF